MLIIPIAFSGNFGSYEASEQPLSVQYLLIPSSKEFLTCSFDNVGKFLSVISSEIGSISYEIGVGFIRTLSYH